MTQSSVDVKVDVVVEGVVVDEEYNVEIGLIMSRVED
jgi:hypothetical protein